MPPYQRATAEKSHRTRRPGRRKPSGRFALTGTPGTGKTTVAALLRGSGRVQEVGDAALATHTGSRAGAEVRLDLRALRRRLARDRAGGEARIFVGHLAHLLPLRDVIVLRCHPIELARRLDEAERGTAREQRENVAAEATDVILLEALSLRRRVWEIDTTGRTPASVAREAERWIARRPPPSYGHVDWLSDAQVTDYLLAPLP